MEGANQESPYWFERREMATYVPRASSTLLDVGCANGGFGRVLAEELRNDIQLFGIDPTPGDAAWTSYGHVYEGSFPADLPSDARFDCTVLNDVLEHMTDP